MSSIIIHESDGITVEYLSDKGIIKHTIHKPISGQPFRDALLAGAKALRENGATKWLSDDRRNGPLTAEDIEWSVNEWQAPTIGAGWKYWAVVVPEELVAAGSLTSTINSLFEKGLRMMVFSKLEAAQAWLDSF